MSVPPSADADADAAARHRRTQRRRAFIGWAGAVVVIALIVIGIVVGGEDGHGRPISSLSVPYGETMSSEQYAAIEEGEDEGDVLGTLGATGRPESRTKSFVLVLFPSADEGDECTYWEFSDEPEIFARLCFSKSSGELVQKLASNVHAPLQEEENATTV